MLRRGVLVLVALAITVAVQAKVVLPNVLSSNAVLQQNEQVLLWGKGTPNAKLTVRPSWTKTKYTTQISESGDWQLPIQTIGAGGAYTITYNDGEELVTENIMLGEVWLCFGQSNMRMMMKGIEGQPVLGSADAIMLADETIPVRYYRSNLQWDIEPSADIYGKWGVNSPENVGEFGATGYFFAMYLQKALGVPVGVVECAWGGSPIEAWMSEDAFKRYDPNYVLPQYVKSEVKNAHQKPLLLYNGLLSPLRNLKFKGALWYQGESNDHNWGEYAPMFKAMVESLREEHFNCGEFPFYYAQIAPFSRTPKNGFLMMREVMSGLMEQVNRTGMVTLSDVGEQNCIHPRYKREVGERFAYWALGDTYGRNHITYRAPEFASMKVVEANNKFPKRVALTFNYAPMGLMFANEDIPSNNFEVAGEDQIFYAAKARIGAKKNHIELWSDQVEEIVAVRYGFSDYFKGDVFSTAGIPISSFRTDTWEVK